LNEISQLRDNRPKDAAHRFDGAYLFERMRQAREFIQNHQPLFYDRHQMWWLWNFQTFCYELVDETDILNGVCDFLHLDTSKSKERGEILNALEQEGRRAIPKEAKDTWIQFKDRIYDLEGGKDFPASPAYFIVNPCPWPLGDSEDTPVIDKLFHEWVVCDGIQDESYVRSLQELVAYCFMQKQSLQRIFALQGAGSNGKGCFLRFLKRLIGEKNVCTSSLKVLSNSNFASSGLYGKKVCVMGEVDAYDMKNTNLLKQLAGEDDILYEFKGKTPFTARSNTTCIVATNALPITNDKSAGFFRKWFVFEFPNRFPTGKNVTEIIPEAEYPNMALKILRICKELNKVGKFTNEGSIEERMRKYEAMSNPFLFFVEEEIEEDDNGRIPFAEFFDRINLFLKSKRLRPMTKSQLGRILKDERYVVKDEIYRENVGHGLHVLYTKFKEKSKLYSSNLSNESTIFSSQNACGGTDSKKRVSLESLGENTDTTPIGEKIDKVNQNTDKVNQSDGKPGKNTDLPYSCQTSDDNKDDNKKNKVNFDWEKELDSLLKFIKGNSNAVQADELFEKETIAYAKKYGLICESEKGRYTIV
jgi:P4 family phage/plasmid primase-like protien